MLQLLHLRIGLHFKRPEVMHALPCLFPGITALDILMPTHSGRIDEGLQLLSRLHLLRLLCVRNLWALNRVEGAGLLYAAPGIERLEVGFSHADGLGPTGSGCL